MISPVKPTRRPVLQCVEQSKCWEHRPQRQRIRSLDILYTRASFGSFDTVAFHVWKCTMHDHDHAHAAAALRHNPDAYKPESVLPSRRCRCCRLQLHTFAAVAKTRVNLATVPSILSHTKLKPASLQRAVAAREEVLCAREWLQAEHPVTRKDHRVSQSGNATLSSPDSPHLLEAQGSRLRRTTLR